MSTKGKAGSKQTELFGVTRGRPKGPKYSVEDAVRMVCQLYKSLGYVPFWRRILMARSILFANSLTLSANVLYC